MFLVMGTRKKVKKIRKRILIAKLKLSCDENFVLFAKIMQKRFRKLSEEKKKKWKFIGLGISKLIE